MAQPAASLAGELRRLIPDLRDMVGDDRRVLVGFDRVGWSPALFADLDAAGFDTLTWHKGVTADIDEHAPRRRKSARRGSGRAPGAPRPRPARRGQSRPAGPGHRDQADPPCHPHRRVQHRSIAGPCDRHRHRLHPRRRRSPHPNPHRTHRIRRHHPRARHPAHPARPAARATPHRRDRRTLPSPQRHQHRLSRHRPDPALQHQIPPTTAHQLLSHVRSPVDRGATLAP